MGWRGVGAVAGLLVLVASGIASAAPVIGTWRPVARVVGIVDVVGPRADGRLVLGSRGGLFLLRRGRAPVPFARGPQGYSGSAGEPYLALGTGHAVRGASCSFRRDDLFVLNPGATPGVLRVDRNGRSHLFASLPPGAFAFGPGGRTRLVVQSGLQAGRDLGVEAVGFVPPSLGRHGTAYLADLGSPGSPTSGSDSLLVLPAAAVARARLRAGDLVVATEAGAKTLAVRCGRVCTTRRVADGPVTAHAEGHITFVPMR